MATLVNEIREMIDFALKEIDAQLQPLLREREKLADACQALAAIDGRVAQQRALLPCPTCGKEFAERGLKTHAFMAHGPSRQFPCEPCGVIFATVQARALHRAHKHPAGAAA